MTDFDSAQIKQVLLEKWQVLEQRERIILLLGSVFTVAILIYSFVWFPMRDAINNYHALLPEKRSDLVWMEDQAKSFQGIDETKQISSKPLLTIIEETAQQIGLREQIQQMSPGENPNEVKVWLSETSFDEWIKWIDSLNKKYSVSVETVNIEREEEKLVDIRVSFSR